jgi:putative membrane protein
MSSPRFSTITVTLVALIHATIAIVEMFFWKHAWAHERLDNLLTSGDVAVKAAPIVTNAGLYNGFIAAGLIWGIARREGGTRIQVFFLVCVLIAGIVGSLTLRDWVPLVIQTVPSALALLAVARSSGRLPHEER